MGRRYLRVAVLSAFLGLVLGYVTFAAVFPTVAVPTTESPPLPGIVLSLLGAALLTGFLTEDVFAGTIQGFSALFVGALWASALALSPVLTGMVQVQGDELVFLVLRLGFPIFLIAVPLSLLGGLAGLWIRERLGAMTHGGSARRSGP